MTELSSGEQIGFPILTVLLWLPVALALVMRLITDEARAYRIALTGCVIELALACVLAVRFIPEVATLQFVERLGPLPFLGISYFVGVDGVNMLFIPLTALLTLLVVLYRESGTGSNTRDYLTAILALQAATMGVFMSLDLILFWMFFVLELVPSYFLITRWGTGPRRQQAAGQYIVYMLVGSALMLLGILLFAMNSRIAGGPTFDFVKLLEASLPERLQTLIFFLMFFGFAVKAPIFPFHTWMPKVLEEGPIVGMSVFLVGIKIGTYGFLRFMIPLLPDAAREWAWLMVTLGVIGMVYGAMIALVESNLRRLLAFSSLSHMGVVMLGLFALNVTGFQGALLQMINLGITAAGLYFVAGFLYHRIGAPELSAMGGLAGCAPWLTGTYLLIALAGVGLPGTSGFNGEHLVMMGAFETHWAMAVAAGLGTFLTAAYFLWYFQQAFLGPATPRPTSGFLDLRSRELLIAAALAVMIFWIGLYTTPFLQTMRGSLEALAQRVEPQPHVTIRPESTR